MIEIESKGRWPTNAVDDIVEARDKFVTDLGHEVLVVSQFVGYYIPVEVHAIPKICNELNQNIRGTNVSYKDFFEKNNIAKIIEDDNIDEDKVIVSFDEDEIQINNIQLRSEFEVKDE